MAKGNGVKRGMSAAVCLLLIVSLLAPAVQAENGQGGGTVDFQDIPYGHWAMKDIVKLGLRGVVSGYEDDTFRPNDPVKQVEALAMAVRMLGLADEAQRALSDDTKSDPFAVPAWAKGIAIVALEKGLIKQGENRFQWSEPATRAWVAQLIVRMLGKESEAASSAFQSTAFRDDGDIPAWARGYVLTAVQYGLVKGYADETFRPNKEVTRAELVVLLSRADKLVNVTDERMVKGKVLALSGNALTLRTVNRGTLTLTLANEALLYDGDNAIDRSRIQVNDEVSAIAVNGTVYFLEKLADGESGVDVVRGTIAQIYPEQRLLVLKEEQDPTLLSTYSLAEQVSVVSANGSVRALDGLAQGDEVELTLNEEDKVTTIVVKGVAADRSTKGIVFDIDAKSRLLLLQTETGFQSYAYGDQVVVEYGSLRYPTVEDIRKGDEVELEIADGLIEKIKVLKVNQKVEEKGTVIQITPDSQLITIKNERGEYKAYPLADGATIHIEGISHPLLSDVKQGDSVTLAVENGEIVKLSVTNRSVEHFLRGTIVGVDVNNRIVTLKDEKDELRAFQVSNAVELDLDKNNPSLSDLKKNMEVEIELDGDDEIIYVKLNNTIRGTVVRVADDRNLLTIKLEKGEHKTYVTEKDVDVEMKTERYAGLEDLQIGDIVELHLDGDGVVDEIAVERSVIYEVADVDEEDKEVKFRDEDGDTTWEDIDRSVKLLVPGITLPTIADLPEGAIVKATYVGMELARVEVLPTVRGEVTSVNAFGNELEVREFSGKRTVIKLENGFAIEIAGSRYQTLNALAVGDRVEIRETVEGEKTIRVMKKVSGSFYQLKEDTNRIYLKLANARYEGYDLHAAVYVHRGGTVTSLRDIRQDAQIHLYLLDDKVYEVEIVY
ncbi:hypothetical protein BSNK01_06290 [Bacillaceae bacterium]